MKFKDYHNSSWVHLYLKSRPSRFPRDYRKSRACDLNEPSENNLAILGNSSLKANNPIYYFYQDYTSVHVHNIMLLCFCHVFQPMQCTECWTGMTLANISVPRYFGAKVVNETYMLSKVPLVKTRTCTILVEPLQCPHSL